MNSIVITLEMYGERIQAFHKRNEHLQANPPEVLVGTRGRDLSINEIIESGLVTQEALASGHCSDGTIGIAATQRWIWQQVAHLDSGALVMEDDVYTHPQILAYIEDNQMLLEENDITFFGYNTDAPLAVTTPQGLNLFMASSPSYPSPKWINSAFSKTRINSVELWNYRKGFGMMAYWISPKGAALVEKNCFPLTLDATSVPLLPHRMPGTSIDRRLCAFYPEMSAWITWPCLAYSENRESSTVISQEEPVDKSVQSD
jgi:hypothetical protein